MDMDNEGLTLLCQCFSELNSIRARDGAPPGVDYKWFDSFVDGIDEYVTKHTNHSAHCNPLLYRKEATDG